MKPSLFVNHALLDGHKKWQKSITREDDIYERQDDIRTHFARDFNRILHSTAYRRLKHKTQVFFAVQNDHICTRMEHVHIVESVSHTIAKYLGLNTELTRAIALGHDLGHAPFGHAGEDFLKEIALSKLGIKFWHEQNSLRFVDDIETLEDIEENEKNLNLTYAVRDGIISHCGEVDENGLKPRSEEIDLKEIDEPNSFPPFSWEGCIVKIADKIAYLGRDIEDAITLGVLDRNQIKELLDIVKQPEGTPLRKINNTILMHNLIIDICKNSNPENGLLFSCDHYELIKSAKDFNYKNIYSHKRLNTYKKYAKLIINTIYIMLESFYDGENTIQEAGKYRDSYPLLVASFIGWLEKYSSCRNIMPYTKYKNKIIYDLKYDDSYAVSIIDYISGMTDAFAIRLFQEMVTFK